MRMTGGRLIPGFLARSRIVSVGGAEHAVSVNGRRRAAIASARTTPRIVRFATLASAVAASSKSRGPRAVVIVLDGVGVGALPDAARFGDEGTNTLLNTARAVGELRTPRLRELGLG